MKKYIYIDCESKNDPSLMGWKNFKMHDMSVGVIGVPKINTKPLDENAQMVSHLFPQNSDLEYLPYYDAKLMFGAIKKFVDNGFTVVGYNTKLYDNNLIAHLCGEMDARQYLDVAIGGNKGDTKWKDVEDGYLDFLINKQVGAWEIAKAVKDYKQNKMDNHLLGESDELKYTSDIKQFLDENSFDIMNEMANITGAKWVSPFDLVCSLTLGYGKSDDGAKVPEMYANGELDKITKYCIHDVRLSWLLHTFLMKYKYVLMPQFKDIPNLTLHQVIKVPFDGSVKKFNGEFIHFSEI